MLKYTVLWGLHKGLFALLLWLWLANGVAGARYVVSFYVWVLFALSVFVLLLMCSSQVADAVKGKSRPHYARWIQFLRRLSVVFNLTVLVVLVWNGQIALGIAQTATMLTAERIHLLRKSAPAAGESVLEA